MKVNIRVNALIAFFFIFVFGFSNLSFSDTFVVTNTSDSGAGSFCQAIIDANTNAGSDTIVFNIPGTDANYNAALGVWTISPVSELPSLTDDSTFVDGKTQSDFFGSDANPNGPEIEISGLNAGAASGITILSAYNVIRTLVINNFQQFGILIEYSGAHHNAIKGCYVGTDVTGTQDCGNGFTGILVYDRAKHNVIGGTLLGDGNLASGNGWSGVEIQGTGADSNLVIGNYIGTDVSGMLALANDRSGINIWSYAEANIVGGNMPEERNIVSGNLWTGISLLRANYSVVRGNFIGVDVNGTNTIPNGHSGIAISGSYNIIGGNEPGDGNLISANSVGIAVGVDSMNTIIGNYIGTDITGNLPFPNENEGILITDGAHKNLIGPGNLVKFNGTSGIEITGENSIKNIVTQNSISQNTGAGIENVLGGNLELAPPTITSASTSEVSGTAVPNSTVEIFSDSDDEGNVYEGTVTADAGGSFHYTGTLTGPFITATATDQSGNTSEFSEPFLIETGYTISGFARYYSNSIPVENASFYLDGQTTTTGETGYFSFTDVSAGNYTLAPQKSGDLGGSITPFDAALILQHSVGLTNLSPYQKIAADVSGNGGVTSYDASYILRYTVALISDFPVGTEWTFVPVDFDITDGNWASAPDTISYLPLNSDKENQDFYGIVYGDVSGNWAAPSLGKQKSGFVKVEFGEITRHDDNFVVPLRVNGTAEIFSGLLKIKFDSEHLKINDVVLAEEFSVAYNVQEGYLSVAFAGAKPLTLNSDILNLNFQKKEDLNSSVVEISEISFNQGGIPVELKNGQLILNNSNPTSYNLSQNYPNPFNSTTKINYTLPQESLVSMVVFDINGCVVRQLVNSKKAAGCHSVGWNMRDDRGNTVSSGVYFYKIEAKALDGSSVFSKFRKMTVIK